MDKNGIDENIAEILNSQEYSVWKVSGLWKSRVQYKWMKKVGGGEKGGIYRREQDRQGERKSCRIQRYILIYF